MVSINKFTERLEDLEKEEGKIRSLDNQSSENQVHLSFLPEKDFVPSVESLGLQDSTSMNNMVLFDTNHKLKRYSTVDEIMIEWCEARFEQYNIRKEYQLRQLEHEAKLLYNKVRFIEMVLNDKIVLKGKDEEQLTSELTSHKFDTFEGSFDYLLTVQVRHMTSKRLGELQKQYTDTLATSKALTNTKIQEIWCKELDELLVAYGKWESLQK